eukprot:9496089-Pyramimonas_sp.AAC.1
MRDMLVYMTPDGSLPSKLRSLIGKRPSSPSSPAGTCCPLGCPTAAPTPPSWAPPRTGCPSSPLAPDECQVGFACPEAEGSAGLEGAAEADAAGRGDAKDA